MNLILRQICEAIFPQMTYSLDKWFSWESIKSDQPKIQICLKPQESQVKKLPSFITDLVTTKIWTNFDLMLVISDKKSPKVDSSSTKII